MNEQSSKKNLGVAILGVAAPAAVALWQFYVFVTFKSPAGAIDMQGGGKHLLLAIGFGLIAFIGAFFLASSFLRYDRKKELHITSPPAPKKPIL